jgi:Icc-related predicted phosphoesterase
MTERNEIEINEASSFFFVTDLHGRESRFTTLFTEISAHLPDVVFLGGDLLPSGIAAISSGNKYGSGFIFDFLVPELTKLKKTLGNRYPAIFAIMGNDDGKLAEKDMIALQEQGLWNYAHGRGIPCKEYTILGYSYVPPTPFQLKDWERYDVSRYVDVGAVSPEEGFVTVPVSESERRYATIKEDLESLFADRDLSRTCILFHAPPYRTALDRGDLDGHMVDNAPIDVHLGSIAIRRFIESRQPLITLHGHVHESSRLTGAWHDTIGRTHCFNAAHDGPELSLICFDPQHAGDARRVLL